MTLTEPQLTDFAERLAAVLACGDCVALRGDLGAGKTTFARALIRAFVGDPALDVPSPTFALRQDYASPRGRIVHFDLYRLSDPRDLDEIGFDEALASAVVIVEWPERAGAMGLGDAIIIEFSDALDPMQRHVTLHVTGQPRRRFSDFMTAALDQISTNGDGGGGGDVV